MGFMGFLSKDSRVTIIFEADQHNNGSTGILAGFTPVTIDPILDFVPPGLTGTIDIPTLGEARRLKIEVDTPEPIGRGTLTVLENDAIKTTRMIPDDTDWVYIIQGHQP